MAFLLAREACLPLGDSQFCVEKWVPEEDFPLQLDETAHSAADAPWTVLPYYRLFKLDGTELMETTDWNDVVGYLQALLGEEEIPSDFRL